jgi:hypothetical protein
LATAALTIQVLAAGAGFAFQFTFGSCTLDTATSTLTSEQGSRVQTPFTLAERDLAAIAEALDAINFFAYPSAFVGVRQGLQAYSIDASATTYRMKVERDGRTHIVSWTDSTRPTTDDADRLRALFMRIVGLIREGAETPLPEGVECR